MASGLFDMRYLIALLCGYFFNTTVAFADVYTLQALIREGLRTNPTARAAAADVDAAQFDLDQSKWALYPSLTISSINSDTEIDQSIASIRQPLWTGGELSGEVDYASSIVTSTQSRLHETQLRVLLEIVRVFFAYLQIQQSIQVTEQNVEEHERLFDLIRRRADALASAEVDVRLAEARMQYAKAELIRLKAESEQYATDLQELASVIVSGVSEPELPSLPPRSEASYLDGALNYSPAVSRYEAEMAAQASRIEVAKSNYLPKIYVGYDRRFEEIFPGQTEEQIYVAVEYRPGAGLSARSAVSAARARTRRSQENIEVTKRSLISEIKSLLATMNASYAQLQPAKDLKEATELVYDSYLRQFSVGQKTWLDVLNSQREAHQARLFAIGQRATYTASYYRLMLLSGSIDELFSGITSLLGADGAVSDESDERTSESLGK